MTQMAERLKARGVVLTPQRLAIVAFLEGNRDHPTADEIFRNIKKKYPTISQATVYNNLEVLHGAGEIQRLTIRKSEECFDSEVEAHHHFFCRECDRVSNIDLGCPVVENGCVGDHKVEGMQAFFYGVCDKCIDAQKAE